MVKASDVLLIIVAILFPPAAAGFVAGCGCDLLINICLTLLGYIPGHIHAFWLIYRKIDAEERYGLGGYHYVGSGSFEPLQQQPAPPGAPNYNYGAVGNNYQGR